MDDLALDAEIFQHAFQHAGVLLQRIGRKGGITVPHDAARSEDGPMKLETFRIDEGALCLRMTRPACFG